MILTEKRRRDGHVGGSGATEAQFYEGRPSKAAEEVWTLLQAQLTEMRAAKAASQSSGES